MPDGRAVIGGLGIALVVLVTLATPGFATQEPVPVDLGVYAGPVRFEAPDGVTFELADGRRYVGTLELFVRPGGEAVLVNDVSMRQYVAGIGEMPARWPLEALKAQAVAARTYAWYQVANGTYRSRGYDICATTACQVFRGAEVVETPVVGSRWQEAVDETAGEALLYEGQPILAMYFSTSGGRTRDHAEVFGRDIPYLRGRPDPDDAVSPLHTWRAVFTRQQFDAILSQGRTLSAAVPVESVDRIERANARPDGIVVTGQDGTTVEVTAGEFRSFVSAVAPDLFPNAFPGPRSDGGSLPTTIPSSRFEVVVSDDAVVVDGSGWGHGVGMGQYGAMGKAERGLTYDEILAFYYAGLRPVQAPGLPDRIRVGLSSGTDATIVRADGPFRVVVGDTEITDRGLGAWTVRPRADRTLRLLAPEGYGAPLVVEPTTSSRPAPTKVEQVTLETVVNKPTELRLEVRDGDRLVYRRDLGVVDPGRRETVWDLDDEGGIQLPPGEYTTVLLATDEEGETAGTAMDLRIRDIQAQGALASLLEPIPEDGLRWVDVPLAVAGLLGLAVGAVGGALVRVRP